MHIPAWAVYLPTMDLFVFVFHVIIVLLEDDYTSKRNELLKYIMYIILSSRIFIGIKNVYFLLFIFITLQLRLYNVCDKAFAFGFFFFFFVVIRIENNRIIFRTPKRILLYNLPMFKMYTFNEMSAGPTDVDM